MFGSRFLEQSTGRAGFDPRRNFGSLARTIYHELRTLPRPSSFVPRNSLPVLTFFAASRHCRVFPGGNRHSWSPLTSPLSKKKKTRTRPPSVEEIKYASPPRPPSLPTRSLLAPHHSEITSPDRSISLPCFILTIWMQQL